MEPKSNQTTFDSKQKIIDAATSSQLLASTRAVTNICDENNKANQNKRNNNNNKNRNSNNDKTLGEAAIRAIEMNPIDIDNENDKNNISCLYCDDDKTFDTFEKF